MQSWMGKKYVPFLVGFLLGNIIFFALLLIRDSGFLISSEFSVYDLLIRERPSLSIDKRIVLIGETEQDIRRFGHPLSDDVLAKTLERLTDEGAWAIGVDKYRDIPVPPGSDRLASILQKNEDIIWVFNPEIPPPKILQDTAQIAINVVPLDADGIVRRGILFMDYADTVGYSFPLMLALRYLDRFEIYPAADENNPEHIKLGDVTIKPFSANDGSYINADDGGYTFLLDYAGMPHKFEKFTLSDFMDNKFPKDAFKGKIVIIGAMAESLNDFFFSPFNHDRSAKFLYGIELHGYITSQLLRAAIAGTPPLDTISDLQEVAWLWFWCMIGTLIGLWVHTVWRFTMATLLGVLVIGLACSSAFNNYLWMPMVPPMLGLFLTATLVTSFMRSQQKAERQMIMHMFESHVSSAVAEAIWEDRDRFMESGRLKSSRVTATVLFTDIAGFSTVSEQMDPQGLMDWLNAYMESMAEVIMRHHGNINKYIGDAIMALFGVPIYRTDEKDIGLDVQNAVNCALDMAKDLQKLNQAFVAKGLPVIGMRVGIYTGPLVAGSLGSSKRMEYTVIGDTVNIASRLESYKREVISSESGEFQSECGICRILIGDNTRKYLDPEMYNIAHYGKVKLKGKTKDVDIYWVNSKQQNLVKPGDESGEMS